MLYSKSYSLNAFIEMFESIFEKLIAIISKNDVKYSNPEDLVHNIIKYFLFF